MVHHRNVGRTFVKRAILYASQIAGGASPPAGFAYLASLVVENLPCDQLEYFQSVTHQPISSHPLTPLKLASRLRLAADLRSESLGQTGQLEEHRRLQQHSRRIVTLSRS
jgi:hypothetical protein